MSREKMLDDIEVNIALIEKARHIIREENKKKELNMLTYTEINTLVSFLEENKDAKINLKSLIDDKYTKEHINKNLLDLNIFKGSVSNIYYDNIFNSLSAQYNFMWCGNHYALDIRYAEIQEKRGVNKIYNVVIYDNSIIVIPVCSDINKIIDKIRDAVSDCK